MLYCRFDFMYNLPEFMFESYIKNDTIEYVLNFSMYSEFIILWIFGSNCGVGVAYVI